MDETLPAKTPLSVRKSRLALFRYSVDNVCDKILFVCEKKIKAPNLYHGRHLQHSMYMAEI